MWSRPPTPTSAGSSPTWSGTPRSRSCAPPRRRCSCSPSWCGRHGFKVVLTGEGRGRVPGRLRHLQGSQRSAGSGRGSPVAMAPPPVQAALSRYRRAVAKQSGFLAAFFGEGLTERGFAGLFARGALAQQPPHPAVLLRRCVPRRGRWAGISTSLPPACRTISTGGTRWRARSILEITIFLSQYLLSSQGDRMGMAHSIEGRFPFLDVRAGRILQRLPPRLKLRCLREKWLLKKAAQPWLPDAIRRRPKRPYRAPIHRSFFNALHARLCAGTALRRRDPRPPACSSRRRSSSWCAKIDSGAPVGETDDMALAGILSTQLVHHHFVTNFRRPEPLWRNRPSQSLPA